MKSPYSPLAQGGPVKKEATRVVKLVLLIGGLLVCGCSTGRGPKVTGSVRLDGEPLPDAVVSFVPKSPGGDTNFALTDAEGHFEVKPDKAKRTLSPGSYTVLIRKYAQKDGKPIPPENRPLVILGSPTVRNILPERYSSEKSPVLTAEIKPGDNALPPFELKSR
jgi:hypothetical protein